MRCDLVWVGLWFLLVPSSPVCYCNSSSHSCNPSGGCCAAEELQAADEECSGGCTAGQAAAGGWSTAGQAEEGGVLCHPHPGLQVSPREGEKRSWR